MARAEGITSARVLTKVGTQIVFLLLILILVLIVILILISVLVFILFWILPHVASLDVTVSPPEWHSFCPVPQRDGRAMRSRKPRPS